MCQNAFASEKGLYYIKRGAGCSWSSLDATSQRSSVHVSAQLTLSNLRALSDVFAADKLWKLLVKSNFYFCRRWFQVVCCKTIVCGRIVSCRSWVCWFKCCYCIKHLRNPENVRNRHLPCFKSFQQFMNKKTLKMFAAGEKGVEKFVCATIC